MPYSWEAKASLDKIFAAVLIGALSKDNTEETIAQKTKIWRNAVPWFIAQFPSNIFMDEYAIFYEIIVNSKIRMFNVSQLTEIVRRHSEFIVDSPRVDLSAFEIGSNGNVATEEEKVTAYLESLREMLISLSNTVVQEEDFRSACVIFKEYFSDKKMLEIAQAMTMIMSDTGYEQQLTRKKGKKLLRGKEDAKKYYREQIVLIEELSQDSGIKDIVIDAKYYEQKSIEDEKEVEVVLKTDLDEIDVVTGGFLRGHMIGILGPPKGGKTRLTCALVAKALIQGKNVCVWPLEGDKEEWLANIYAHIVRINGAKNVDSKEILQKKVKDEDTRMMVEAAKLDLAAGKKYGRLSFIEHEAYVEDFIDKLDDHWKTKNAFDVLAIDSLLNILSKDRKTKNERISESYMRLKHYISKTMVIGALALLPAQLKQDVIDKLRNNPDDTLDVTSGGESAETIRSPDEVIGLFSSKAERASKVMHIYHVASRHSENFEDFMCDCDLASCYFTSNDGLNH